MSTRFTLISNNDPDISYTEEWQSVDSAQFDSLGNSGPPIESSLHGISGTSGSYAYFFHGSSINVIGTVRVKDPTAHGSIWGCFIDGVSLGFPVFPNGDQNNWSLCQQDLPDGPHELQVVANSTTDPLYIDYILYTPSIGIPLDNTTTYISSDDPAISYDSTWVVSEDGEFTADLEGKLTIPFVGESLAYYGYIPSDLPHLPSSGQFSVDGAGFSFALPGIPSNENVSQDILNQKIFSTGNLTQGPHTVTVQYNGNSNLTPLTFSFALVFNGTSSDSSDSSSNPPPLPAISHHTNHDPAIIGGVVAGGVVIAIVVVSVVVFLVRRRFRRQNQLAQDAELQRANTIGGGAGLPTTQFLPTMAMPLSTTLAAMVDPAAHAVPSSSQTPPLDTSPHRSNTLASQPKVAMAVLPPSSSPPHHQNQEAGSSSGSSTGKEKESAPAGVAVVNRVSSRRKPPPPSSSTPPPGAAVAAATARPEQITTIPELPSEHIPANEITPMLMDEMELDDEDYDVPPPTYSSRADNSVSSEKRYLVRQNR